MPTCFRDQEYLSILKSLPELLPLHVAKDQGCRDWQVARSLTISFCLALPARTPKASLMATAVSVRPAGPPSKPKRPAPPALQTGANGTTSYSSPSPSLSSKRPPSGYKHPPSASTAGSNGIATPNGTASRLVRRKDSQKTGDAGKPRPGKSGPSDTGPGDKRIVKKIMEPYVKTTAYMLRKYRKQPPSFILHLHPTHFRFDQQDGTFSYNSPMRTLLENIKNQTVPHEMQEELHQAGIKFYESA